MPRDQERYRTEHVEAVRSLLSERSDSDEELFGLQRVDLELEGAGNGPFRARRDDFEFFIDEPPTRAGTDAGPNPLVYFVAGAAGCFLSHLMILAIGSETVLDEVRMSARGYYDRRTLGGHFTRFVYDLRLASDEAATDIEDIVRRAEKMCYAHNTLARADVRLETNVTLNGSPLLEMTADTDHMPE